jgi:CRISPR-associated protein Cas2
MLHIVCYDISDDRIRNEMSDRLLDYGVRIQESVFECVLDPYSYARMMESLDKVRLATSDKLRIYKVCQNCLNSIRIYGPGEVAHDPDYYLI